MSVSQWAFLTVVVDSFRDYLRKNGVAVLVGVLITLVAAWLLISSQPFVRSAMNRLDYLVYDLRLNYTVPQPDREAQDVIIVDIDEASLANHGRWPWSRIIIADLIVRLHQFGATAIGLDMSFPEPERNPAQEVLNYVDPESAPDHHEFLLELAPEVDRDALLASVLAGRNVVLGILFLAEDRPGRGGLPLPWYYVDADKASKWRVPGMGSYASNLPPLTDSASEGGFLNATPDDDGVVRRTPLITRYGNLIYPSISLAVAKLHNNQLAFKVNTAAIHEDVVVTSLQLDSQVVRTDQIGRVLVPYSGGRESFEYISATDILTATSLEEFPQIQGKSVLVGATALGLYDLRNTPIEPSFPGVEIQANVLQGLIDGIAFPQEPDWGKAAIFLVTLALGLSLSFMAPALSAGWLVFTSLSILVPVGVLDFWLWTEQRLAFSPVIPGLLVLSISIFNGARGFFSEAERREEIRDMFGQYVPEEHIDRMLEHPGEVSFEGETREMSVLFADIRNFTTISEGLEVSELKQMLNDVFTPITAIIFEHQGTIDKYIGDLVMAFWGAPLEDRDHRKHAILAALKMLEKVEELNPEFDARGLPEVHIGVGINSGSMNVGDMGSTYRRAYTVLGDAVNLASRLEQLTKFYGVSFLVGEATRDECVDFLYRHIDLVRVKGKDEPIRIYEPLCYSDEADHALLEVQKLHDEAMGRYTKGELAVADQLFEEVYRSLPIQQVAMMRKRIKEYSSLQVKHTWTGVFNHQSK